MSYLFKSRTKEEHRDHILASLKWHGISSADKSVDEYLDAIDKFIPMTRDNPAFQQRVSEASLHGVTKPFWNKIWGR
jgi:lambda repressor-like predicted transcriptional regulator